MGNDNNERCIPLSATMLCEGEKNIKLLNVEVFSETTGWFEKFKSRHNIVVILRKISRRFIITKFSPKENLS